MNRIELTRNYVKKVSSGWLFDHLEGVAQAASELARRRGENEELAEIAGYLHDIARAVDPYADKHGPRGSEIARTWLESTKQFSTEEIDQICHAIFYHSKKRLVHSPFDEVLKDGDVYHHVIDGIFLAKDEDRIESLMKELR